MQAQPSSTTKEESLRGGRSTRKKKKREVVIPVFGPFRSDDVCSALSSLDLPEVLDAFLGTNSLGSVLVRATS